MGTKNLGMAFGTPYMWMEFKFHADMIGTSELKINSAVETSTV
jgi:hypothetical protein